MFVGVTLYKVDYVEGCGIVKSTSCDFFCSTANAFKFKVKFQVLCFDRQYSMSLELV